MEANIEEDMSLYEIDFLSEDIFKMFKEMNPKTIIRLRFGFEKFELEYENYIENKRKLDNLIEEAHYEKCNYGVYINVLDREDGEKLLRKHFKENKMNYREMKGEILSYKYDLYSAKRELNLYDDRKNSTVASIEREFSVVFEDLKKKYPILEKIGILDIIFDDEEASLNHFIELQNGKISVEDYFRYLSDMIYKKSCKKLEEIKESQKFGRALEEIVFLKKELFDEKEKYFELNRLKEMFLEIFGEQNVEEVLSLIKEKVEKLNTQKSKTLASYKDSVSASSEFNTFDENIKLGYFDVDNKDDYYEKLKKEFYSLYDKKEKSLSKYNAELKEEEHVKEEVINSFSVFVEKIITYIPDFMNNSIFRNQKNEPITLKEFIYDYLEGFSFVDYHAIAGIIINAVFSHIDDELSKTNENILIRQAQIYEKVSLLSTSNGDNPEFVQLLGGLFSESDLSNKKMKSKKLKKI